MSKGSESRHRPILEPDSEVKVGEKFASTVDQGSKVSKEKLHSQEIKEED